MILFLNLSLLILVALITTYVVRHYLFTIFVLFHTHKPVRVHTEETHYEPYISIIIPSHNEEHVIRRILQRMTELTYPKNKLEVIVIDDASTDRTYEIATEFSKNYPFIKVLKRNKNEGGKGKPEALNSCLKYVNGEIIYCFDADYWPQLDIVEKLTAYFRDPKVGAVQGRVTVLNEPSSLVTRLIALERIGGYRVDQFARNLLGLIPQFGGTVGGFRKTLLESLGGWDPDILAEDTDLTFKVCLAGFKIKYVNEAECYEEAVENWRSYWVQRSRWAKGHMQCAFKHLFPLIRSKNLSLREKIDGLLLLNIYFVPILVALAWILGVLLFFVQTEPWFPFFWFVVPIFAYSSTGNFAPFFEVGIGAYLDERTRICWLIPLLLLTFIVNVLICTKALFDLSFCKITRKKKHKWSKTVHNGKILDIFY